MAGHNQSPLGNFATISTLPYWKLNVFAVEILALWIGFKTFPPAPFMKNKIILE
jgi:hypothetical protein